MSHERRSKPLIFALASALGCGPSGVELECVSIDEKLGDPGSRQWCEGQYYPETLEWNGQPSVETIPVCLAPKADGECAVCPVDEISDAVEVQLLEDLAQYRPGCQLEHWELGCMRTIENAILIGREPEYCCFQVALWGDGCDD